MDNDRKRIVISGIGSDRPGIVAAITQVLNRYQANIEDSSMTRLASEFATILAVSLPATQSTLQLEQEIKQLEQSLGLSLLIRPVPDCVDEEKTNAGQPYIISVAGHDRTGITFHISQKLAELNINITDLSARTIPGEEGLVYIMMVEVEIPSHLDFNEVNSALQAVGKTIGMEVQLRPLETLAL